MVHDLWFDVMQINDTMSLISHSIFIGIKRMPLVVRRLNFLD